MNSIYMHEFHDHPNNYREPLILADYLLDKNY
jgi:hypothetical protein